MSVGTSYSVTAFIEVACFKRFSGETLLWIKLEPESIVGQLYVSSWCWCTTFSDAFTMCRHNSFTKNNLLAQPQVCGALSVSGLLVASCGVSNSLNAHKTESRP